MCPEFNNEVIKDISEGHVTEPDAETISSDNDNLPEADEAVADVADEVTEGSQDASEPEEQATEEQKDETREVPENDGGEEQAPSDAEFSEEPVDDSDSEEASEAAVPKSENYLLYGGTDIPEGVNYKDTLAFLTEKLKYDGGELRQAREKKDGSGIINPDENATEICSYCQLPISGVDYYRLPDGRKRCTNCNRSLVKSLEELNTIFNEVLINMELFFGATIDVPISVEMLEERKLKRKVRKGLGDPPKNVLILGVAVEHKGKYTVYVENGIPRASLIATLAHELTHIWQYTHWNRKSIKKRYGGKMQLVVYEGMAKWTEIQYLYHIGEQTIAKREEFITLARKDAYGIGFALYVDQYPINRETKAFIETPFSAGDAPLNG